MSLKGFFSIFKGQDETPDYATFSPVQRGSHALDVAAHIYVQLIASDAVEALSTTRVLNATAHVAKRGDLISFTSGALNTREVRVQETTANTITLCEELESTPANGVTFGILRNKASVVSSSGSPTIDTTGLATSAKQDAQTALLTTIDADTGAIATSVASMDTKLTTLRQGRAYADSARHDYSGATVTTGAWTELITATAAEINELRIFDSSGRTLELGTGAAASETRKLIIPPGGFDSPVGLRITVGTRISVRAISADATSGELTLTGLT